MAREGRVTALKEQVRNRQRVNVYLEGRYAFSLPLALAARIGEGSYLSEEEVEKLLHEDMLHRAYQKALNLLSYRPRSKQEIQRRLERRQVSPEIIDTVIRKLAREGMVDDLDFARWWVENREDFRPRGRALLRYELLRQGVDEETVAQAVEDIDEERSAWRAGQGYAARLRNLDEATFRRRLTDFLRRRGFSYSVAQAVVAGVAKEREELS
ncbi:MAG: RecX family transcriptional regulator [Chloroflexi bacterium]|nr:RecX family transcriptional regulator [Chloroflexota bacterium]